MKKLPTKSERKNIQKELEKVTTLQNLETLIDLERSRIESSEIGLRIELRKDEEYERKLVNNTTKKQKDGKNDGPKI